MKFYHGTTEESWSEIQKEGLLFGKRNSTNHRVTYLAIDKNEAKCYGPVLLEIEYNPSEHPDMNNYVDGCWQFRVYEPIEIINIKKI